MANKQMNQLTNLPTMASDDLLVVYDIDGAGNEKTKNMTYTQFHSQISGTVGGGGGWSGGTPTYMLYNDVSGDLAETANMTYDVATGDIVIGNPSDTNLSLNQTDDIWQIAASGTVQIGNSWNSTSHDYLFMANDFDNFYAMSLYWYTVEGHSLYGEFAIFAEDEDYPIFSHSPGTATSMRQGADYRIVLHETNKKIYFDVDGVSGLMQLSADGLSLIESGSYIQVNEILSVFDDKPISAASTDSQLATAKNIYDHVNTVSGSLGGGGGDGKSIEVSEKITYTSDGLIDNTYTNVHLNSGSNSCVMTLAPREGSFIMIYGDALSNTMTVELTSGTFDGSANNLATFSSGNDFIYLFWVSSSIAAVLSIKDVSLSESAPPP
jgi:hypothetical protein